MVIPVAVRLSNGSQSESISKYVAVWNYYVIFEKNRHAGEAAKASTTYITKEIVAKQLKIRLTNTLTGIIYEIAFDCFVRANLIFSHSRRNFVTSSLRAPLRRAGKLRATST